MLEALRKRKRGRTELLGKIRSVCEYIRGDSGHDMNALFVQQQENTNQMDNTRENLSVSVDPRGTVASERINSDHDTGGNPPPRTTLITTGNLYIYSF